MAKRLIIEIDDKSGFCFGVVNAITRAEKYLNEGKKILSLGYIVHNKVEMNRLKLMGLDTITHSEIASIKDSILFIRAHGEPPSTYRIAHENNIPIVDATCPVVSRLQTRVKKAYDIMQSIGGQVVILGKPGHAEVIGLIGQIDNNAIIVQNIDDINRLVDTSKPVYLLSQTTQSLTLFNEIKALLESKYSPTDIGSRCIIDDTICRNVSNREPHLKEFVSKYDLILFVAGRDSSNGKVLYNLCKETNSNCHFIEDEKDILPEWFNGINSVGICGATSTPRWLMERIYENIHKILTIEKL